MYFMHLVCLPYVKSHDMAFFIVALSHMAAYCPLAISCFASQQSWKVPDDPVKTLFLTPCFAS